MTILDHLLVLVFAIAYPIAGYVSFQRLLRRAADGEVVNRPQLYLRTALGHWSLFFVALAAWAGAARPFQALGFGLQTDTSFLIGAGLTVAGCVALVIQLRQVTAADDDTLDKFRSTIGKLELMIPRNGNELARFYGLSLTAGIVEETLWRGFLIWYLLHFMPTWAAALISAVGFGVAHAYQGLANLPRIALVGAAFVGLYLLTGSLWLPMILHAAVDIAQGRLAYELLHRTVGRDTRMPAVEPEGAAQ